MNCLTFTILFLITKLQIMVDPYTIYSICDTLSFGSEMSMVTMLNMIYDMTTEMN